MRSKALPGWAHTLCTAAAALVFLLAYELVVYRVPVTEIFLPVSSWSDEVIYSKQLAAACRPRWCSCWRMSFLWSFVLGWTS